MTQRIDKLFDQLDTAWAQGGRGDTEQPVELLIEITKLLSVQVDLLNRTRQASEAGETNPVEVMEAGESVRGE